MTNVPLVIYDDAGNRIPIGDAEVEIVNNELVVTGHITNPNFYHLIRDDNLDDIPSDYSVEFLGTIPQAVAHLPIPAIQKEKDQ